MSRESSAYTDYLHEWDRDSLEAEVRRLRESECFYHQRRDAALRDVGRYMVRESRARHLFLAANKRKRGYKKTAQIQSENILETGDLVDRLQRPRQCADCGAEMVLTCSDCGTEIRE